MPETSLDAAQAESAVTDPARSVIDDDRDEQRTIRYSTPHPALCGYRCCATPADYADLRDAL